MRSKAVTTKQPIYRIHKIKPGRYVIQQKLKQGLFGEPFWSPASKPFKNPTWARVELAVMVLRNNGLDS